MDTVMGIVMPVMNALEKIHGKGMIHRDVSPSNIMILPDGRVRLLDFGAAKEFSLETINMTTMSSVYKYGYSPIEQLTQGMKQGPYTDIYALCATIYEMLTGVTPPTPFQRTYESVNLRPISSYGVRITPMQEEAIQRGLEINAADRIQTIQELRAALSGIRQDEGELQEVHTGGGNPVFIIALGTMATVVFLLAVVILYRIVFSSDTSAAVSGITTATEQEPEQEPEPEPESEQKAESSANTEEKDLQNQAKDEAAYEKQDAEVGDSASAYISETAENTVLAEQDNNTYYYNGHTYAVYDQSISWTSASSACEYAMGHLVTVQDDEEEEFIKSIVGNKAFYWLGGYKDDNDNWRWVTDEMWEYTDWSPGQPDNYSAIDEAPQGFLVYSTAFDAWDDQQENGASKGPTSVAENAAGYICEWDEIK